MALVRCILDKFLGVVCHCFPSKVIYVFINKWVISFKNFTGFYHGFVTGSFRRHFLVSKVPTVGVKTLPPSYGLSWPLLQYWYPPSWVPVQNRMYSIRNGATILKNRQYSTDNGKWGDVFSGSPLSLLLPAEQLLAGIVSAQNNWPAALCPTPAPPNVVPFFHP
jgi:hypothetical protein